MSVRIGMALALLCTPACLSLSLFERSGSTKGVLRALEMKSAILERVPLGSSLARARRFMEREGFKCEQRTNDSFMDGYIHHTGVDFLLCTRTDQAGADQVDVNWEVAIALTEDTVGDVWLANDLLEMPDLPITSPYSRIPPPK